MTLIPDLERQLTDAAASRSGNRRRVARLAAAGGAAVALMAALFALTLGQPGRLLRPGRGRAAHRRTARPRAPGRAQAGASRPDRSVQARANAAGRQRLHQGRPGRDPRPPAGRGPHEVAAGGPTERPGVPVADDGRCLLVVRRLHRPRHADRRGRCGGRNQLQRRARRSPGEKGDQRRGGRRHRGGAPDPAGRRRDRGPGEGERVPPGRD